MKAVFQRVSRASVSVDSNVIGEIDKGVMLLVGIAPTDTTHEADVLAQKVAGMRVFCDENDKMNLSVLDIKGSVLAISQFTLLANIAHGRRPDFFGAAPKEHAAPLFDYFCDALCRTGVAVQTGAFGEHMEVSLVNDGPVTIMMDTDIWKKER